MSLFKKEDVNTNYSFSKDQVINSILNMLEKDFSAYKVIMSKDDPWDMIIIRLVSRRCIIQLGNMGLHESVKESVFQEVFVVNVMAPDEELPSDIEKYAQGWTKAHIIVSDAPTLKRKLLNEE